MAESPTQKTLFVGSLSEFTSEAGLKEYFETFGKIVRAKLITDSKSLSKQCALIFCKDEKTCRKVLKKAAHWIDGKQVRITQADDSKKSTKCFVENTLFIGNIHYHSTETDLWNYFGFFGDIISLKVFTIAKDAQTLNCIINFRSRTTIDAIMSTPNKHKIRGRRLRCSLYKKPKSSEDESPEQPEMSQHQEGDYSYYQSHDYDHNSSHSAQESAQHLDFYQIAKAPSTKSNNQVSLKEAFEKSTSHSGGDRAKNDYYSEPYFHGSLVLEGDAAYELPVLPSTSNPAAKSIDQYNPPFPPPPPDTSDTACVQTTRNEVGTSKQSSAVPWEPGEKLYVENSNQLPTKPLDTSYCYQFVLLIEHEKDPLFQSFYSDGFFNSGSFAVNQDAPQHIRRAWYPHHRGKVSSL